MTHLQNFQQRLESDRAALISSAQNTFYLSGFRYDDGYLLIFPSRAVLLTDFRYEEAAQSHADSAFEVLCPKRNMLDAVRELLAQENVRDLLIEEESVTVALRESLDQKLTDITVHTGASARLKALRVLKDEGELAAIAAAQEITDAAFSHILGYLKQGVREIDVALELEFFMRRAGADGIAFHTIAVSGAASSLPHGVPRNCPLERGFLTMDFGARVGGYCADMTRTVVIGRADAEMKRLYDTVLKAQRAALDRAAGGVSCRALDLVARDIIDGAGYEGCFGHSLGHGVGLDVHEDPRLSRGASESAVLLPGHVVTVEPGIYLAGKYGCRIEDMIAVNADGSIRNFTKSTKELIEI
ncbi:MAG: aminopeptidase P family protein [Clostridia bacterium]|nr:aminopeptidase P family protein [Clostridia bacterium]